MATSVALAPQVYLAHLDLTTLTNLASFPLSRAMQPCTTYGDGGYACVKPGLISGEAALTGYQDWAADVLDDELSVGQLGTQYPLSIYPNPGNGSVTAGDVAWIFRGVVDSLNPMAGAKGEMAGFELGSAFDTACVRGLVLHPKAARTATTNGTAVALTGPTASQSLYAALHVTAYSGFTNVVFTIESDDGAGFASPTTRITFSTVTGTTYQWSSVAGNFSTETHVRVVATVTGSGSVTFACAAGVV